MEFNIRKLHEYCTLPIAEIWRRTGAEVRTGRSGCHGFIDNGGKVLAVAHLDIAGGIKKHQSTFYVTKNNVVHSVALDDRLGAYLICDFLPGLGLKYDILLTENEEIGMSTASDFDPLGRKYNWIFEFDRRGNDVVMYEYDCVSMEKRLTKHGFRVGTGSFSDICYLEDLGVKGMNFGTGYFNEHSLSCHANLKITAQQVDRFLSFYGENVDTKLYHEALAYVYSSYLPRKKGRRTSYHYGGYGTTSKTKAKKYASWTDDEDNDSRYWDRNWFEDDWSDVDYNEDLNRFERPTQKYGNLKDTHYGHAVDYWDIEGQEWIAEDPDIDWAVLYPKYEDAKRTIARDYSIDIDNITWADYCGIVGIDPNNQNTWDEDTWIIAQVLDLLF